MEGSDMPVKCYQLQLGNKDWKYELENGKANNNVNHYTSTMGSVRIFKPHCLLSFGKMHERKVRYMCGDCSEVSCCPNALGQNDQTWTTTTDPSTCQVQYQSGYKRKCRAADTNIAMRESDYRSEEECTPTYMGSADIQEKCGDARPPPPVVECDAQKRAGCQSLIAALGKGYICSADYLPQDCNCECQ
jgi:hypothetical protein